MQSCEDAGLTKTGEWAVRFSYGTVKGESKCGSLSWGEYEKMKSNTDTYVQALNTEGDCWCGYSVITSNIKKPATEWEFADDLNSATECETGCALRCVKDMPESIDSLRISLFGALEDMTGVLTKGMKGMVDGMEAVMKDVEDK